VLVGGVEVGGSPALVVGGGMQHVGEGAQHLVGFGAWASGVEVQVPGTVLVVEPVGELVQELGQHAGQSR